MKAQRSDSDRAPIRLSYFQRVRNIGDLVAPYIIEDLTHRPAISARSTERSYLLSIGSLMQTSTRRSFVWGTGLVHPSAGIGDPDARRVLAVRGKLTHAELVRNGVHVGDVPLGDPGFLIPRLLPRNDSASPRFALGLVPHFVDRDHPFFLEAAKDPSIKVLNVCGPADVFFAELATCGAIASTSLHGLIFGEALGLPTLWLEVSDKVLGQRFKFADWFSLARNPQPIPLGPDAFASFGDIVDRCEPRQIEIDPEALAGAVTPDVIEECSRDPHQRRALIPVAECRRRPLPVFLISRDNAEGLGQMLASLQRQAAAVEIVVYDDGSHEPQTVDLLAALEHGGMTIYRRTGSGAAARLDRVNGAVRGFFDDWAEPSRYAIADCANDVVPLAAGAVELYDDLLDRFPRVDSVGPAISTAVGNRAAEPSVVNCRVGHLAERSDCTCVIIEGGFDLGFAVYRAGKSLAESMQSLRVCVA